MAEDKYTRQENPNGAVVYRLNGKLVKTSEVPQEEQDRLSAETPTIPSQEVLDSAKNSEAGNSEEPGGPQEPNANPETYENEIEPTEEKADKANPLAKASPKDPKALDKAKAVEVPEEEVVEVEDTIREDEKPGGPQEPQTLGLALKIDSAEDVDDESGLDVEEQDRASRLRAGLERDEDGMGFKRVNGKTVDIFDQKTPHTAVRYVGGIMVPLTQENYDLKSDVEIVNQLKKLKKI